VQEISHIRVTNSRAVAGMQHRVCRTEA
jgi:hypothetical protein